MVKLGAVAQFVVHRDQLRRILRGFVLDGVREYAWVGRHVQPACGADVVGIVDVHEVQLVVTGQSDPGRAVRFVGFTERERLYDAESAGSLSSTCTRQSDRYGVASLNLVPDVDGVQSRAMVNAAAGALIRLSGRDTAIGAPPLIEKATTLGSVAWRDLLDGRRRWMPASRKHASQ
jgi:hypothetical protein